MCFDASPWGVGGFLVVNGVPVSWFATRFTDYDEKTVGIKFGTSASQQVAESQAILFGLRTWEPHWVEKAPRLEVRSDSVSALSMVARMQSTSPHIAFVAREIALSLSKSCIRPAVVEYTPGVANGLADALSRRFQPGASWCLPSALKAVPEQAIVRSADYYRTAASIAQCTSTPAVRNVSCGELPSSS